VQQVPRLILAFRWFYRPAGNIEGKANLMPFLPIKKEKKEAIQSTIQSDSIWIEKSCFFLVFFV